MNTQFLIRNTHGYDEYLNNIDNSVLISIPEGEVYLGSSALQYLRLVDKYPELANALAQEQPAKQVRVASYLMSKYPVTNEQYLRFVQDTEYEASGIWRDFATRARSNHPVVGVTWSDAMAYCEWAGLRLPSEAEWERAAKADDNPEFPWGDSWAANMCNNLTVDNLQLLKLRTIGCACLTLPVGSIPSGASAFGVQDLSGNVWEFCDGWFSEYGEISTDNRFESLQRVLRGGSWHGGYPPLCFRCSARLARPDGESSFYSGFRCALDWQ